ncbi:conserved hypothetical protein [Methanococcus maripaludis C5]|uniref:Uncharacterized protein n=1 Tax=Methanococcus maripaludis (strain C5 / ATCC BAA-1333) TaxID=402880 RepID=A4G016_METM5|nr:hypothetical protein [Methanococcus maripaludis]ABO35800.1 conserved hypothetical protein [Methanococcus maripaludis C5]
MNIAEIFGVISNVYNLVFSCVFGLCGIYYPLFVSGIISMSVFFVFRSTNKSIIALIVSAIVILLIPITPYEAKLVAIVLAAVSSVFFIVLFRKVC